VTDQIASDIISVGWLVENKIFGVQIGGEPETHTLTILDSLDYDPVVLQYLDAATEPIHILIHIRPLKTTPPVSRLLALKYPRHPRTGHIVIVNTSNTPMVRFFMSVVGSVSGVKIKGVQSVEEGLEYLHAVGVQS
jgi:hypothetical protein